MIVDNAIDGFEALRAYADTAVFRDHRNGPDGVVYPLICTDVPAAVAAQVVGLAAEYMQREPQNALVFMRLSPKGAPAPHQAHADHVMGTVSLMLYLNRAEHCQGGTSLVRHRATGMATGAEAEANPEAWSRDTNRPDAWEVVSMAAMKPNRAFVFDANLMHRAEPIGGFGRGRQDARLVLTGFFS